MKPIIYSLTIFLYYYWGLLFLRHLRITKYLPLFAAPEPWFYFYLSHISRSSAHFFVTLISVMLADEIGFYFYLGKFDLWGCKCWVWDSSLFYFSDFLILYYLFYRLLFTVFFSLFFGGSTKLFLWFFSCFSILCFSF